MLNVRNYLFLFLISLCLPLIALAQEENKSLSLTLTPPLFQIGIAQNTEWKSTLRLVNSNDYEITVYARAVSFRPEGESGNASFSPYERIEDAGPQVLANWIRLPEGEIKVPRGGTAQIPFSIKVPGDASPGGHYAAILVGTQAKDGSNGPGLTVGSLITSLLFVRVPGDVREAGSIRDFYAERSFVGKPEATFQLRFENTGNVHILPQGQIEIFNMWGKKRGFVEINDENNFGNVLPSTTRKFTFTWSGEANVFEAGRYHALATLNYGDEEKRTVYRDAYFWVIPWKPMSMFLLFFISFVLVVTFTVRRYVRRVLELERRSLGLDHDEYQQLRASRTGETAGAKTRPSVRLETITAPIRDEVRTIQQERKEHVPMFSIIKAYRGIVFLLLFLILCISLVIYYFISVFQEERAFRVEVKREGGQMMVK